MGWPFPTHTHTFNGPLSRTTWVSRYQKGKTNLDFTEARDSEWQWHQLGHIQVCTLFQTDNHTSTPPLNFYRPDALPAAQPTASEHWRPWPFPTLKYKYIFQIKYTETILSNSTQCTMVWNYQIADCRPGQARVCLMSPLCIRHNKFIVSFVIILAHFRSLYQMVWPEDLYMYLY